MPFSEPLGGLRSAQPTLLVRPFQLGGGCHAFGGPARPRLNPQVPPRKHANPSILLVQGSHAFGVGPAGSFGAARDPRKHGTHPPNYDGRYTTRCDAAL